MSLRLKYLLTLNLVIAAVWGGYTYWNYRESTRTHMRSEVNVLRHLGLGLRLLVVQAMESPRGIRDVQKRLDSLSKRWRGLDVMVLDRDFRVLAATLRKRVGKKWIEEDIKEVLEGKEKLIWKMWQHRHDGHPSIDSTIAVPDENGEVRYAIHLARRLDAVHAASREQRRRDLTFAAMMLVVVGILLNALTYKFVIAPLDRSYESIRNSGWLDDLTKEMPKDEVQRLTVILDELLTSVTRSTLSLKDALSKKQELLAEVERLRDSLHSEVERVRRELLQTQDKLLRAERLASLGRLSGGLAHELRNPLHIIRGTAETARRRVPDCSNYADELIEEVDRIQALITQLLDYTRPLKPNLRPVDVEELLEEMKEKMVSAEPCLEQRKFKNNGSNCGDDDDEGRQGGMPPPIDVRSEIPPDALRADGLLLSQALLNLLSNACEASPPGARVTVVARVKGDLATFDVEDRGPGISTEDLKRVFEPFFTRKPAGTGLGLCIVQRVADLHGGEVFITSPAPKGGGTVVTLAIPLQPELNSVVPDSQEPDPLPTLPTALASTPEPSQPQSPEDTKNKGEPSETDPRSG